MDEVFAAIDGALTRVVDGGDAPGAAWGVVVGGSLAHAGGAGTTAIEDGDLPNERTLFRIASMTKSFTAATVLALRDEGALALDDPIAEHLPWAATLRGPTADSPAVTVRHLLGMGSGLPTDDPWADRHLDLDDAAFERLVAPGAWFAWPTAAATQYSNLGYVLLGRLVAARTGRRCQDEITDRFLRPLGLDDTVWEPRDDQRDRAAGHERVDGEWVSGVAALAPLGDGAFAPMGGLWSTVADMSTWVAFFLDAFPARDDPDGGPLRRASRREMQQQWRADELDAQPCRHCDTVRATADGYGAGLRAIADAHVGAVVSHSGGLPGFGSNMRWLPERGIGIVSLGNATYAPMAKHNRAAFDALAHGSLLPALRPHAVPAPLAHAAHALVALLNDWDDTRADALFADNVVLDESYERRRRAAHELVGAIGRVRVTSVTALHRADVTIEVQGDQGGAAKVLLQLHPLVPPRVQWYEIER